jgi:hypothetical protein
MPRLDVQAHGRLVEDEQVRTPGNRQREQSPLALPAGQLPEAPVGEPVTPAADSVSSTATGVP